MDALGGTPLVERQVIEDLQAGFAVRHEGDAFANGHVIASLRQIKTGQDRTGLCRIAAVKDLDGRTGRPTSLQRVLAHGDDDAGTVCGDCLPRERSEADVAEYREVIGQQRKPSHIPTRWAAEGSV